MLLPLHFWQIDALQIIQVLMSMLLKTQTGNHCGDRRQVAN